MPVIRIFFLPLTLPFSQLAWAAGGGEPGPPLGSSRAKVSIKSNDLDSNLGAFISCLCHLESLVMLGHGNGFSAS